jgi:hypothetical protein
MKQKVIIGFSLVLLLLAVFLIARDLFRPSPSYTTTTCCGDEDRKLKEFDSTLIGYNRIRVIETGLNTLTGIAIDDNQKIFLCGNKQVAVFDTSGNRTGGFSIDSMAGCIAVSNNNIYIGTGAHIAQYDKNGDQVKKWKAYNAKGYITSIAIGDDYVYAADAMNKRILKYSANGDLVKDFGKKDSITGATGFVIPSLYFDIAFGGFNDLWIVNPGWLRVENYTSNGYFRSSWGEESFENSGFVGCCNPVHMSLLPNGSFVTYEKGIDKIKVFDQAGKFICMVAGAGSFRENADFQIGNNNLVKDMAADNEGLIYVLDAYNRVNIFKKMTFK